MNRQLQTHVLKTLNDNVRYDGRKKEDYREVTVELGVTRNAEGSARVRIGKTDVIAGVKMSVETPYPDKPDEGTLMVNSELLPLASPNFESGPPSIEAIELSRVVDRGIREAGAIDTKKLCITPGEKVWIVMIDVVTITDDGNLYDAASLAALAALKNAKFPKYTEEEGLDYKERTDVPLPLLKEPLGVTVYKIGEHLILDPVPEEEKVIDARLTIASVKDGTICALQKGGEQPLKIADIDKMCEIGLARAKELRKLL